MELYASQLVQKGDEKGCSQNTFTLSTLIRDHIIFRAQCPYKCTRAVAVLFFAIMEFMFYKFMTKSVVIQ